MEISSHAKAEFAGSKSMPAKQENAILRALARRSSSADKGEIAPTMAAAFKLSGLRERLVAIAAALADGRVILPVLPHAATSEGDCPSGQLPQIHLKGASFAPAVPVYSSLEAMNEAVAAGLGNKLAPSGGREDLPRPLPVGARALAIAALDSPGRMLLDDTYLLPRPLLNALASADTWVPSWENPTLLAGIARVIRQVLPGADWEIVPQIAGPDRLLVAVDPNVPRLAAAFQALQKGINSLDILEAAADLLEVTPVPVMAGTSLDPSL